MLAIRPRDEFEDMIAALLIASGVNFCL